MLVWQTGEDAAMPALLLIDDDQPLLDALTALLEKELYLVRSAVSLRQAHHLLSQMAFDVVVVDRVLPDGDGLEMVQHLASNHAPTRILVLTTRGLPPERISGFKRGADDYLTKPFVPEEFLLRVKRLMASEKRWRGQEYQIGELQFSPESGKLVIGDQFRQLRRREAQLLTVLFRHRNQVVTRAMFIDLVWAGHSEIPSYPTIDVYIRRLRQYLGPYRSRLKTVKGVGYRLEAE